MKVPAGNCDECDAELVKVARVGFVSRAYLVALDAAEEFGKGIVYTRWVAVRTSKERVPATNLATRGRWSSVTLRISAPLEASYTRCEWVDGISAGFSVKNWKVGREFNSH